MANTENSKWPEYSGVEEACKFSKSDVRIFGKPNTRKYRRMAVALAWDNPETDVKTLIEKAKEIAAKIKVT